MFTYPKDLTWNVLKFSKMYLLIADHSFQIFSQRYRLYYWVLTVTLSALFVFVSVCYIFVWLLKLCTILGFLVPLITVQSNLVVTCTTSCTCHHETDLAWVNSFNNICFKHRTDESSQTRQFRGLNIDCENDILWFNPRTYIFLHVRWLDVPSEGHITTRVDISLLKNEKSL